MIPQRLGIALRGAKMAEILIVLLGFIGTMHGIDVLSKMSLLTARGNSLGLLLSCVFETAGSSMAVLGAVSGDFMAPVILLLMGIALWGVCDRRKTFRKETMQ